MPGKTTGKIGRPGCVAGAALLVGLMCLPAEAQDKAWRHGILEAKSDAGIIMMPGQGFAEKQGLKLDFVQFKSDVVELQALLSGDIDSFDGGPAGSITAAARGADVKVIGCHWPGLPYGIFVRPQINSIADLRGKSFAISTPGASPDLVARAVLARNGIAESEVRFANLGSDVDRFKALAAGVVDAAVVAAEYVPIAEQQGVKMLLHSREILPNQLRSCVFSSAKRLAARPEDAIRFMAGEMAGLRYALGHRAETLALTRQVTGIKPEDPRPDYVFDEALASHAVDPDFDLPADKLQWMTDQLLKIGNLPHPYDVTKMFNREIREKALARTAS